MDYKHVVVDGSNIATEGRSLPSLAQLDEAVRAFLAENEVEQVTVIVDATFGHRIEADERPAYEEAILAGELVTPPAGAIGRGDAFVLQIADQTGATILSNDSFQEFHGDHEWLFDEGRLIGGKPVPGVGWVFVARAPVRGPTSRRAVRMAKNGKGRDDTKSARKGKDGRKAKDAGRSKGDKSAAKQTAKQTAKQGTKQGSKQAAKGGGRKAKGPQTGPADSGDGGEAGGRSRRRRSSKAPLEPINEPLPFIEFVAEHPVGTELDGVVERFSSHGAYVDAGGAVCYVPLQSMGEPAPRSPKDVLEIGSTRRFTVASFDSPRRGIDLALVEGDTAQATTASADEKRSAHQRAQEGATGEAMAKDRTASSVKANTRGADAATTTSTQHIAEEAPVTPAKKSTRKAAKKAPAKKKAAAKKAPARKKATAKKAAKKAPARKKAAKKAPARKKATAKKATKKAPARKKAAKKAPARKKATAKKATRRR